ncbi:type II secretion system minor pseudopilin GspK [Vibrio aestuarianus]|uniref:type II secretion system minor pseudopilin GspK n=1 Tax=Vibrio aestuarianus TaxID=28171 RepID=UPI002469811C|nr:type II secretion system minor pseudopilin GspK [Vibrio aestuarianus]MDH5875764.1 type II secretion system minor pseudopilin GspK [Vibrio aestuarianus]
MTHHNRSLQGRRSQQGVALIVILLLLAIMVSIAATMSERLFTQFQRASNQINYQQAYWYSLGVESLAQAAIEQSYKDGDNINLSQPWALEEQTYPLDYGTVKGRVTDKQACFNLNVLARVTPTTGGANKPYLVQVLQHLLEESEVDSYQAEVIADSAWEYIDDDSNVQSSYGVEDSYYESMSPAYLAANTLLADSSELRAVQQVTGGVMQRIAPYVCALPSDDWRLNVNTVAPESAKLLVAMFSPHLSESDAKNVLENRPFDGWGSVDDFLAEASIAAVDSKVKDEAKQYLSVDSAYFELDAQILVDDSRVRIRSLLFSDNRETATVVRRRFGGISERVSDRSTE